MAQFSISETKNAKVYLFGDNTSRTILTTFDQGKDIDYKIISNVRGIPKIKGRSNKYSVLTHELKRLTIQVKLTLKENDINNVSPVMHLINKSKLKEMEDVALELSLNKDKLIKNFIDVTFGSNYNKNLQETIIRSYISDKEMSLDKIKKFISDESFDLIKSIKK